MIDVINLVLFCFLSLCFILSKIFPKIATEYKILRVTCFCIYSSLRLFRSNDKTLKQILHIFTGQYLTDWCICCHFAFFPLCNNLRIHNELLPFGIPRIPFPCGNLTKIYSFHFYIFGIQFNLKSTLSVKDAGEGVSSTKRSRYFFIKI